MPAQGDVRDLVVGGPGFAAVGRDGLDAAVWTSPEGATWQRVPATKDPTDAAMNRVAIIGSMLIAIGKAGADGAIWTSSDGDTWAREDDGTIFEGYQLTVIVVSG